MEAILVTGGAGFIGSNFVSHWLREGGCKVAVLDKLTYAGNLKSLSAWSGDPLLCFVHDDIGNRDTVGGLLDLHRPRLVINFAGETHVDRSIRWPSNFVEANVMSVQSLLEEARRYWQELDPESRASFRFLQVSTDEVYGPLREGEPPFSELSPYNPSSPYAASKAAADHLFHAYHCTYGLPALIANCSNTYGPYQHPEKLVPLTILNALQAKALPVYGDGAYVRDWLHVADLCEGLRLLIAKGAVGARYNVAGGEPRSVIAIVQAVCDLLDEMRPRKGGSYRELICHVADRPGHDRRYALDTTRLRSELGWRPRRKLADGLRATVRWYLDNLEWVEAVTGRGEDYRDWLALNYGDRRAG